MRILSVVGLLAVLSFPFSTGRAAEEPAAPPKAGDIVPAPGPREKGLGISGPGALYPRDWGLKQRATGSAVKAGLIPNLCPLIPGVQLRDTIVIVGGDGNIISPARAAATSGITTTASSSGVRRI